MTRFITFRDVVLNTDAIQYVIIREDKKNNNIIEYVANVCYNNGDGVSFPYSTEENAKQAIAQIYNLLNPPAMITDGGVIINVPEGTDPTALPITTTTIPSTTIGQ